MNVHRHLHSESPLGVDAATSEKEDSAPGTDPSPEQPDHDSTHWVIPAAGPRSSSAAEWLAARTPWKPSLELARALRSLNPNKRELNADGETPSEWPTEVERAPGHTPTEWRRRNRLRHKPAGQAAAKQMLDLEAERQKLLDKMQSVCVWPRLEELCGKGVPGPIINLH